MMKESEKLASPENSRSTGFSSPGAEKVPSTKDSRQVKSIRKQNQGAPGVRADSSQDDVLVENRQETVSCIFYPYKHGMQNKYVQGQAQDPTAVITDEVKARKETIAEKSSVKSSHKKSNTHMNSSVVLRAGKSTKKVSTLSDEVGSIVTFGRKDRLSPSNEPNHLRNRQGTK